MTRKFKVGDYVRVTSWGPYADASGEVEKLCTTASECYVVSGLGHLNEKALERVVTPQNLDQLQGKVDEALDRLEAVEGRVDKLEQAGGTPLVETTATTPPAAQNPTRKFKIGDQVEYTPFGGSLTQRKVVELCAANDKCYALSGGVHVNESILSLYNPKRFKVGDRVRVTERNAVKFGQVGVIERLGVKANPWDYDYRVSFNGQSTWGYNDDELDPAPYELKVGDVVRIVWKESSYKGKSAVVTSVTSSSSLPVWVGIEGRATPLPYKIDELVLLRTAEEDAKLKADEQAALKQRALKALEKLSFQEEIDVREYLKGESK